MEDPELNVSQDKVSNGRKNKSKLESDVATIWRLSGMDRNASHVPNLTHASDHARNTTAEGQDSGNARREALGMIIVLRPVSFHATLEVKVVGEGDAFVDGQPVPWNMSVCFRAATR